MNKFLFLFCFLGFLAPPFKKMLIKTSLDGSEVKLLYSILWSWTVSFQILLFQRIKLIPDARSDQISMSSA